MLLRPTSVKWLVAHTKSSVYLTFENPQPVGVRVRVRFIGVARC